MRLACFARDRALRRLRDAEPLTGLGLSVTIDWRSCGRRSFWLRRLLLVGLPLSAGVAGAFA